LALINVDKYQIPLNIDIFIFLSINIEGIIEFLDLVDNITLFFKNLFLKNNKDIYGNFHEERDIKIFYINFSFFFDIFFANLQFL
jgi:hypothetical protein